MALSLCPPVPLKPLETNCDTLFHPNILILGSLLPFIARFAVELASKQQTSVVVALDNNESHDNHMMWYYIQQMTASGVEIHWLDNSNETNMEELVAGKTFGQVIYSVTCGGLLLSAAHWTRSLQHLVAILQVVTRHMPCAEFVYVEYGCSSMQHSRPTIPSSSLWQHVLRKTVSMYNRRGLPVAYVLLPSVYGPWVARTSESVHDCWYIDDVISWTRKWLTQTRVGCHIFDLTKCPQSDSHSKFKSNSCFFTRYGNNQLQSIRTSCTSFSDGKYKENVWRNQFTEMSRAQEDFIFTTYFTSAVDPQRQKQRVPNRFGYMKNWYGSVNRHGLKAVVFHDELSPQFVAKLTNENITFVQVPTLNGRSTNDVRFYIYLEYLQTHSEVKRVLLTDISDVVFQQNPFHLMDLLGNQLYIGTDIDFFPSLHSMPWISTRFESCFGKENVQEGGDVHRMMLQLSVYNAGVIGGKRSKMMAALHWIVQTLNTTPHKLNCNMPAVNYAIHRYFSDVVYTGFPLTSRFLQQQSHPKGVYITHK